MTGLNKSVNWNAIWNTLPMITEEAEKSEIEKMQNVDVLSLDEIDR